MPPLMHNYEGWASGEDGNRGERFDMRKSEACNWLMEQPWCRATAEEMLVNMLASVGAVEWVSKGRWRGCRVETEGMHYFRSEAIEAAAEMPELVDFEMKDWLMGQGACYQFAANRLWSWLSQKLVIRCHGKMQPWCGIGAGGFREMKKKRMAERKLKLRAYWAERRRLDAPRKAAEKAARLAAARARMKAAGYQEHPDAGRIKEVMCSFSTPTARAVIFRTVMEDKTLVKVSIPTLERYRQKLVRDGLLVSPGKGMYHSAPKPMLALTPALELEEPVYL